MYLRMAQRTVSSQSTAFNNETAYVSNNHRRRLAMYHSFKFQVVEKVTNFKFSQ